MKNVDYAKTSSDNIRLLLLQNKISVRQLAEEIGIAPTTLNDSLKSKKGIPIDSLIKIADFFKITVNDLCNPFLVNFETSSLNNDALILNKYMLLDRHGKDIVSLIIDKELERMMSSPLKP